METPQVSQLPDISKVRVVEWRNDLSQDDEVNEAIQLGWKLLLVQPGEFHPSFVLGWSGTEAAPQTAREKRSAQYAGIGRVK
jgi:hypothetical protein